MKSENNYQSIKVQMTPEQKLKAKELARLNHQSLCGWISTLIEKEVSVKSAEVSNG